MKKLLFVSLSAILALTMAFSALAFSATPAAADKPVETKTHDCNGARCPDPTGTPHDNGNHYGATKQAEPTSTLDPKWVIMAKPMPAPWTNTFMLVWVNTNALDKRTDAQELIPLDQLPTDAVILVPPGHRGR